MNYKDLMSTIEELAVVACYAKSLGFSLIASGTSLDIVPWNGESLSNGMRATSDVLFEGTSVSDVRTWLTGAEYAKSQAEVSVG